MFRRFSLSATLLVVAAVCVGHLWADDAAKAPRTPPKTAQAWTLDEAIERLTLNPDNAYLQYVVLQLGQNERRADEAAHQIELLQDERQRGGRREERRVDLFDLFAGATAVQESLQLDTMLGDRDADSDQLASPAENTVRVADLAGPEVESHPWGKMLAAAELGGKKPEIGPLDLCVPEDQYYIAFRSLTKLLDAVDAGDVWGSHLFNQAAQSAKTQRSSDRLKMQLAIQTDPLTRPFYDMVVDEVAITGGDVFFREGSDVTMLFRAKQPEVLRMRMDGFLESAAKSRPDAVRSTGRIGSVDYVSVCTPDRAIHVFSAYPRPDLHLRSNSKPALERVLAAVAGEKGVARLGDSAEFRYIRTLMPRGAKEEDGLIYLSDPFIRRLVGPELKLTERRRLICYNHLRMIGHAAMLYRTQFGKQPGSLEELAASGCASAFAEDRSGKVVRPAVACPCGGKYSLATEGETGVCSHHGNALELVPCREIAMEKATRSEAEEYWRFVAEYSQYWRRYFDPIAIRVQVTPQQYRAETIVLPLIDNSIYTGMAAIFGGEPEPLDALPVPEKNIFSVVARVNKAELLKHDWPGYGIMDELFPGGMPRRPGAVSIEELVVMGLGNQVGMHVYDASPMFDFNLPGFLGEMLGEFRGSGPGLRNEMLPASFLVASLNSPVYLAIPVRDEKIVDKFLDELDETLAVLARRKERGGWIELDYDFYRVNSTEKGAEKGRRTRCYSVRFGPVRWRLFFERIGGGLYIASQREILDDLAAAAKTPPADQGPTAHAMIRVRPEHWKDVMPSFRLGWAEGSREACLNNLGSLGPVARALAASGAAVKPADVDRAAGRLYGAYSFCPDGGKYEISPDGREVHCSLHGTAMAPRQMLAPSPGSPTDQVLKDFGGLVAELTFLEDGLHAVVTIERAGGKSKAPAAAETNDRPPAGPEKAVQGKPVDARDHCMIADALAHRERVDDAIKHYQKALELDPGCAEAHNGLGLVLTGKRQYDEATAHYRKALELKPDYAEVYCNLGNCHWAARQSVDKAAEQAQREAAMQQAAAKAIEDYESALKIKPDYAEAHNGLGLVLAARGRADEATGHYQKAAALKPDYAEVHNNMGSLLAGQGRSGEAVVFLRKAIELKWDYPEAHVNLAKTLARRGESEEAIHEYERALLFRSDDAETHNSVGELWAQKKQTDEAIEHFQQALKINPDYAEAKKNLEAAQAARGAKD
ncbi:MAG: tetratricopeptide repeat protein [Planctomycetia bacterium]|nr:tetratricopeptide repeat protein [Planctomycetia bacterium]